MLNQAITINAAPAQGTVARSDASNSTPKSTSNAPTSDAFGTVLARQIDEKNKAAAQPANASSSSNTSESTKTPAAKATTDASQPNQDQTAATTPTLAPDAASIAMNSILGIKTTVATKEQDKTAAAAPAITPDAAMMVAGMFGNQGIKASAVASLKEQDKAPAKPAATPPDAATMVAGMFGNQGITPAIANDVSGNAGKTGRATGSAAVQQAGSNAVREKTDPAMTVTAKADTALQPVLKNQNGAASLKLTELSASLTTAAPSPQVMAQSAQLANLPPDTATNTTNTTIAAPLGSSAWPAEFAQKISWVSTQQNQVAELHLNPPDLGPMSVTLSVTDNQATALFSSPHSAVREAIENAMPKLRESLAENGITLGNTTVSDQAPRDNGASNFMNQRANTRNEPETDNSITSTAGLPVVETRRHNGLVDTFA